MKISLFIVLVLAMTVAGSSISSTLTTCTCATLYVLKDCAQNSKCSWNSTTSLCETASTTTTTVKTYCDAYTTQTDCAAQSPCAWSDSKCVQFSGCTVFLQSSTTDCQTISPLCVSNGTNCVTKETTTCGNYLTQTSCENTADSIVCYWDSTNTSCIAPTSCDQLPTSFTTDTQCRTAISTCTISTSLAGCTTSGTNCSDQTIEGQCVNNAAQTTKCFWNSETSKCVDFTCENAPTSYSSNDACVSYYDSTCTTTGSGCVTRTTCAAAVQNACTKDISGTTCYWNTSTKACVNLTCSALLSTYTTNAQCQLVTTSTTCISNGAGCVDDSVCGTSTSSGTCTTKRKSGLNCYWDTTTSKCVNAACSQGTTTNCSTWTSSTGGCYLNGSTCTDFTSCTAITNETSCTSTNSSGTTCYWNDDAEDEGCYTKACTVLTSTDCQSNSSTCTYNAGCSQRQCSLSTASNYTDCKAYLDTCIYSTSNQKCVTLPLVCSQIDNELSCKIRSDGTSCAYVKSQCYDTTCSVAPTLASDTFSLSECQLFSSKCVPASGLKTCETLPSVCENRAGVEGVCLFEGSSSTCAWNSTSNKCVTKSCADITFSSSSDCTNYKPNPSSTAIQCVIGATSATTCVALPADCTGLGELSCKAGAITGCIWYTSCVKQLTTCTYTTSSVCNAAQTTTGIQCKWNSSSNACENYSCSTIGDGSQTGDADCQAKSTLCAFKKQCAVKGTTCESLLTSDACSTHILGGTTQCTWDDTTDTANPVCKDATFDCTKVTGTGLTFGYCQNISSTCSVNNTGTACIDVQGNCTGYGTTQASCVWASTDGYCYWDTVTDANNPTCVKPTLCSQISLANAKACAKAMSSCTYTSGSTCTSTTDCTAFTGPFTYDTCQSYNSKCAVNRGGTACFEITANCSAITSTDFGTKCTLGLDGPCKYTAADAATEVSEACTVYTSSNLLDNTKCATVTLSGSAKWFTATYCLAISASACSVADSGQGCVVAQTCVNYSTTQASCVAASDGTKCNHGTTCAAFTNCASVTFASSTDALCSLFGSCVSNGGTGCKDAYVCSDITGTGLTFGQCQNYLNTCSVAADGKSCVTLQNTCALYTDVTQCAYSKNEGECTVDSSNLCVQKTCTSGTATSAATCQNYSSNCTIGKTGSCQNNASSCTGLSSTLCTITSSGTPCSYYSGTCYDASSCTNAPAGITSYSDCQSFNSTCTLDESDSKGCVSLPSDCSLLKSTTTCQINSSGNTCYWDYTVTSNHCSATASTCGNLDSATYITHDKCHTQNSNCTVYTSDGSTLAGCTSLKSCTNYNYQQQCVISSDLDSSNNNIVCKWNSTTSKCVDDICANAATTYTTAATCATDYGSNCTVASSGTGCQINTSTCENLTESQCTPDTTTSFVPTDSSGNQCYYDTTNSKCVTKTCSNADLATLSGSDSDCKSYLSTCGKFDTTCTTTLCEDTSSSSETTCAALFSNSKKCTTNGTNCVTRGTCEQALVQAACTTDSSNNACQWTTPSDTSIPSYCQTKSCTTAPLTTNTETLCKAYWPISDSYAICTSKSGGGCIIKGICTALTTSDACQSVDSNNKKCQWDTTTSPASCRYYQCSDVSATSNSTCLAVTTATQNCILASSGTACTNSVTCSNIGNAASCVKGTDGPCYWVPASTSTPLVGSCYLYYDCTSVNGTTFAECQLVNTNCTTNGTNCVALTSCANTNSNGCYLGTDGQCVYTSTSSQSATCQLYTSCSAVLYTTHTDCMNYTQNKCTSDGTSACIDLTDCASYGTNSVGCVINSTGAVTSTTGLITSTGKCIIDTTSNSCRDKICSDYTGATESECKSILSTCTSDGTNCLTKLTCSSYSTKEACTTGNGTDGYCIWTPDATDSTQGTCALKVCSDLTSGLSVSTCTSALVTGGCVYNGTACIATAACSTYSAKTACNSGGTDGVCVWTATSDTTGTCALMTSCSQASSDSNACGLNKSYCKWTAAVGTTSSSCADYTCLTYQTYIGSCKYYPAFGGSTYNICEPVSSVCTAVDPTTLTVDYCYKLSAFTYSWTTSATCQSCSDTTTNSSNSSNSSNSTTTDTYGILFGLSSLVIGSLLI